MRSAGHPGHQGTVGPRAPAPAGFPGDAAASRPAGEPVRSSAPVLTRVACAPIHLYRALSANRLPHCRYWPSCSAYALESVETHGPGPGLALALRRIARCHPWGGSGVDPVPPRPARSQVTA